MKFLLTFKGGPGSGHRGHSGRPGKRGGSVAGTGGLVKSTAADRAWVKSLSKDEMNAVRGYMNAGGPINASAGILNSAIRKGRVSGEQEEYVRLIDSAIAKAPKTTKPTVLYRGMHADRSVFDGAFVSAGRSISTAETYSSGGRIVKKFIVPAGTPMAPLSVIFFQDIADEVLLPRTVDVLSESAMKSLSFS